MLGLDNQFVWNDQMYIENNEIAWFSGCEINALFKVDLKRKEYTYIKEFPDYEVVNFRKNSICFKYDEVVFCFPDLGENIWVYELKNKEFNKISIYNPRGVRLGIMKVFQETDRLFAISIGLKQIIEIDAKKQKVSKYYSLFEMDNSVKLGWECIEYNGLIYCVVRTGNRICEFNKFTKEIRYYEIPCILDGITTICCDGDNFWFSGYRKEIYLWNKKSNKTRTFSCLPEKLGMYKRTWKLDMIVDYNSDLFEESLFINSFILEDKVWFIPYQANKIIYIDRNTFHIDTFDIDDEEENGISWSRGMNQKYIVEYIIPDKYIGLYSFKNKRIIEIDVNNLKAIPKKYIPDDYCKKKLRTAMRKKFVVHETGVHDINFLLDSNDIVETDGCRSMKGVGHKIFWDMKNERG